MVLMPTAMMMLALLAANATQAVVVKPVANMYSQPTEDAEVVSQAIYGTTVGLLEEQSGWVKVRTADQYSGWVPVASLRRLGPGEQAYAASVRVTQVESFFANIYREPDATKHQPLATVPFETRLELMDVGDKGGSDKEGRWLKVHLPDDRVGWVQRGDVGFGSHPLGIGETIAFSKRFLSLPYVWGGVSTFGFDCSGFMQMLGRRRGVVMPRDSSVQAKWTGSQPVDRSQLKPGDLLYFGQSKVTHTGMYIGDGQFISATTHEHPEVQVSDIKDPYWSKLFISARRIE